jgi:inorganic pyrophosphatase
VIRRRSYNRSVAGIPFFVAAFALAWGASAQYIGPELNVLPSSASSQLAASLEAAQAHTRHVWRDTPPTSDDGLVNAYVEIPRGERRKFEFDMRANERKIDRVMPDAIGGYPVNYGFVPQTVSYDGDPFDVLVLGPALPGGELVRGVVVGVMFMEDEKGLDSKTVLSPVGSGGRPTQILTAGDQKRIADYFRRYKQHETGKFSKVPGWGTSDEGKRLVAITHAFFQKCRTSAAAPCRIEN